MTIYPHNHVITGGIRKAEVCFGSNGSPGTEGPAYRSECWFTQKVEIHNCDEFYLYKLPKAGKRNLFLGVSSTRHSVVMTVYIWVF